MPIFALSPAPGDVDILIAAELVEAGRAVLRGFVTPDRTTLIASQPPHAGRLGKDRARRRPRRRSDKVLEARCRSIEDASSPSTWKRIAGRPGA